MSLAEPIPPELRRALVTPEGVDLRLGLASAGQRAGAFLLDAAFIGGGMAVMTLACVLIGFALHQRSVQWVVVLWLLGFFLLRNAWFLGFELGPRAATPGKRAFGLRVASRQGGRLTTDAVFARNAMREIEVFLPLSFLGASAGGVDALVVLLGLLWTGVFVFFPLFNRDRLRVGDLVAGTWVVLQPSRRLAADLAADASAGARFAFTPEQVEAYGVAELQVLEEVLRASDRRAMRVVADRIRTKLGWLRGAEETDRAFLDAYYAALRTRLEADLLRGRRRRDKHDTQEARFTFTSAQLDAYGPTELKMLADVLRGGDADAVRLVAERIAAKIGWTPRPGPKATQAARDRAFLNAYQAALSARLRAAQGKAGDRPS